MRLLMILLLLVVGHGIQGQRHAVSKLVEAAMDVLKKSMLDETVRECSCNENSECIKDMQSQAVECSGECWKTLAEITPNQEALQSLRQCITTKIPVVGTFIRCLADNLHGCVESQEGPQTQKIDLKKMFNEGEHAIITIRAEVIRRGAIASLRPIGEAVLKFAGCLKSCFVEEKNADGFCYEKKKCQPIITEKNLRRSLRTCIGNSSWKNHAADLCECATNAGVEGLKSVCSLLNAARTNG